FQTFVFTGEWSDLVDHIAAGRPLIVSLGVSARGAPLHYVVVAGIDEPHQVVLVNDPAQRKLWPMSRAEFEQRWNAMDRWTVLAVPEFPSLAKEGLGVVRSTELSRGTLISASDAFRRQDYARSRKLAEQVLRDNSESATANELLATIYFLQNNVEAA